jgi:hypothetical protein
VPLLSLPVSYLLSPSSCSASLLLHALGPANPW